MNGRIRSVMLSSLLALPVAAQQPAAKPAPKPAPKPVATKPAATETVDPRVQRMREQIRDGKEIRSHVRITVRLKNGNRMQGVVKDIRLVERIDGVRFAKADPGDDGAGIRLWYSDGRNNYVFLPFTDLQDYKVQEKLTSVQLKEIEAKLVAASAAAPTDPNAAAAVPQADATLVSAGAATEVPTDGGAGKVAPADGQRTPPSVTAGEAKGAATNGGLDESQKKLFALLQEFPLAAGWDQKRRDEIARRKAVLGATPSAAEQKFVDEFSSWQQACELFGVEPAKEAEPAVEETGRRSKRKKD